MKFSVVTVLPELIERALDTTAGGVVGRAREAGVIIVETINPRDFTHDKHRTVDDTPYGGGPGMVMKAEPLLAAIARASEEGPRESSATLDASAPSGASAPSASSDRGPRPHRIFLGPAGTPLTQARVKELARLPHLVLVCGRYEGIDERVIDIAIDEELSIGDYVLSGGELAALVVIDACARLVPGVLGEATSAEEESHSAGLLEYPQYTRPPRLGDKEIPASLRVRSRASDVPASSRSDDLPDGEVAASSRADVPGVEHVVPAVLSSGNHAAIAAWRRQQSLARTAKRRPDLFTRIVPTKADRKLMPPPIAHRTHLALVHHPVVDRHGKIVTSSLTNFDIHDLARSTTTYDLAAYHIVTPITSQREKAEHIASLWLDDPLTGAPPARKQPASGSRAGALARVRTADSVETAIANITAEHGAPPIVVGTSARPESFPSAGRISPSELLAELAIDPSPLLILLGTGWGLADALIPSVTRVLAPIEGGSDWNHLSVRSAGAILLDRLFDKQVGRPT